MKINVLGTSYSVYKKNRKKDDILSKCDGYCDKTSKKIVVIEKDEDNELEMFEVYQRKVLRHEIIHAFLFESGLHENFEHTPMGHEETMIDWYAAQYPKIKKAFVDAGCAE